MPFCRNLPPLNPGNLPPDYINVKKSKKGLKVFLRDPEIEKTKKVSDSLSIPAPPVQDKILTKKEKAAVCYFLFHSLTCSQFINEY